MIYIYQDPTDTPTPTPWGWATPTPRPEVTMAVNIDGLRDIDITGEIEQFTVETVQSYNTVRDEFEPFIWLGIAALLVVMFIVIRRQIQDL
jgi:hypothetical protein